MRICRLVDCGCRFWDFQDLGCSGTDWDCLEDEAEVFGFGKALWLK